MKYTTRRELKGKAKEKKAARGSERQPVSLGEAFGRIVSKGQSGEKVAAAMSAHAGVCGGGFYFIYFLFVPHSRY